MLGGEGTGSPKDGGSDQGAEGNVSLFLVYKNLLLTHHRRNDGKVGQVTNRPSTKPTPSDHGTPQKKSGDGEGYVVIPYDAEALDNDPPVAGSTAGIMIEREPLKKKDIKESKEEDAKGSKETDTIGFKGKDAEGPEEKPEVCCDPSLFRHKVILTPSEKGKGRMGFGRWNKGKETEQAIKTVKDEKAQNPENPPPVSTLPAPSKAGGNERPTRKVVQAVGGAITDKPSLWPLPSVSSTSPLSSLFLNLKPTG